MVGWLVKSSGPNLTAISLGQVRSGMTAAMPKPEVSMFWDNSNIYIPAKFVANRREGGFASKEIRIQFDNLYALATFRV